MDFGSIINGIKGLFNPQQQETISPLPVGQTLTPGIAHKMQYDAIMEENARKANLAEVGQPTPTPQNFHYYGDPTDEELLLRKGIGSVSQKVTRPIQETAQQVLGTTHTNPEMNDFETRTRPTFDKYNIDPAVAYGIGDAEGGKIGTNNRWNINAVDSNPGLAFDYNSPEAAATGAAQLMQKMIDKQGAGDLSPFEQLVAIQNSGYAGKPNTWKKRSMDTGGAGNVYDSWSEFVSNTPSFKRYSGR